jgi:DDE superfamily endonuclease
MRLLQRVLPGLSQTKQPQRKFLTHLLGLLRMLPGHATFRNLSRYSSSDERTFARWYARECDFVSRNKAAITHVTPPEHEQALVIDASFAPKSGKKTYSLDPFWNGRHGRSEKGLEISALAWLDIMANCAYSLSVEQTPPTREATDPETTRIDLHLDQLTRVISAHDLSHLRYVITDGYDSKQKFINGVHALGRHQMGKRRIDTHLRYLYQGPKRLAPRRPKTYDGKVNWDDLTRFEPLEIEDDHLVLYHQVVNHVQFQCNLVTCA